MADFYLINIDLNLLLKRTLLVLTNVYITVQSFPTPMEEPKKVLRGVYLGSTEVNQATGMDVLNDAIDLLSATVPRELWKPVNVAVAPSMISILQQSVSKPFLLFECTLNCLYYLFQEYLKNI